jgi:hypothetical protein
MTHVWARSARWCLAMLLALGFERTARADTSNPVDPFAATPAIGFEALNRPTGIAELGFGWLTLPGADVCLKDCSKGDTSFELDVWQLYRPNQRFAFGAGALLALIPTNAGPALEHRRRYMTIEGTARYYPYVGQNVEWWVGVTGGLVIVSDRYVVGDNGSGRVIFGGAGQTIRSEGGTIGLAGGPVIALARNWTFGVTLRYGEWFLPTQPAADVLANRASLAGRSVVISLGLNMALRLAL